MIDTSRTQVVPALDAHSAARRRAGGVALLIVVSVLWSLGGLGLKTSQMPAVAFAFYRALSAAVAMLLLMPLSSGRRPPWRWMLFSAAVYTVVVTFVMSAMKLGTAASGILLQYTSPAFCALLAWVFQRRRIGPRTMAAMLLAAAGIGIMIFGGSGTSGLAAVYGVISGVAFGGLALILEKIDREAGGKANPFQIVLFNNAGAALILLPFCYYAGTLSARPWQLGIVTATGAIQLAVPYVLFQLSLRRVSPVDASLLILLEPILNPVWVAIAVGERPDLATIIGGVAILGAMVIEATKPAASTED